MNSSSAIAPCSVERMVGAVRCGRPRHEVARMLGLDPERLVFSDGTWTSASITPRHGRCERGKRLIAHAPSGHWKTTAFAAALRHDGVSAPCAFDGPINGAKFLAYVAQCSRRVCRRARL